MRYLIVIQFFLILISSTFVTADQKPTGTELIESKFTLINHKGENVTEKDFYGKYTLIFFGFTHCPKICPLGLHVMTLTVKQLGDLGKDIIPIFITIDPDRDTIERISEYVAYYDDKLVGLTGSEEALADAAKAFRAYYGRINSDNPDSYSFDHSAVIYFMDKQGKYLDHYSSYLGDEEIAKRIKNILKETSK